MESIISMIQSGDAWGTLTYVCYGLSLIFFIITIILAFTWNINALWDELSGKRRKREIANYNANDGKDSSGFDTSMITNPKNISTTDTLVKQMWAMTDSREMNINNRNIDQTIEDAQNMANYNQQFVKNTMADPNYYEDYNSDGEYIPEPESITINVGKNRITQNQMNNNISSYVRSNQSTVNIHRPQRMSSYDMSYNSEVYEQPTGFIDPDNSQHLDNEYEQPTGFIDLDNSQQLDNGYEQPTGFINPDNSQQFDNGYEQPTGFINPDNSQQFDNGYEQPTGFINPDNGQQLDNGYEQPTGFINPESTSQINEGYEQATGYMSEYYEEPTGFINPNPDYSYYEESTGHMNNQNDYIQSNQTFNPGYYTNNLSYDEQPTGYLDPNNANDLDEEPTGYLEPNNTNNLEEQPTGYLNTDNLDYRDTYMSIAGQLRSQKETNEQILRDVIASDTSGDTFRALQQTVKILSNNGNSIAPHILIAGGSEKDDFENNLNEYNL